MLVGCDRNIKPVISTNVKDWEMFQMINHTSNSRVIGIEIFLLIFGFFFFSYKYCFYHTHTHTQRKKQSFRTGTYSTQSWGAGEFSSTQCCKKGVISSQLFIDLLSEFIGVRNYHRNHNMEAMIYCVLVKIFAVSYCSHALFR